MSDFDPFAVMRTLDGPVDPPQGFSDELYTSLRHALDRHAVGAPLEESTQTAPSPRRGLLVAAAVVAAFFAMGGLLSLLAPPAERDANVDPLPLSEPDPTAPTSLVEHNEDPSVASPPPTRGAVPVTTIAGQLSQPSLGGYQFGGWNVLPSSEFDGRLGSAVVWTGEQLIVWGGEVPDEGPRPGRGWPTTNEGGFYDPGSGIWLSLPPSPLSARSGVTALWTGTEMLIIGTDGQDGAAYNPGTRLWRELPGYWVPSDSAAVWTGTEAILWGGVGHSGVAYNPSTDSWRNIADADLNTWNNAGAVWTGEEMIMWNQVVRGSQPGAPGAEQVFALDVAAYDPINDSWRRLPPQDFEFELSTVTGVWTGDEVILLGANFERRGREGEIAEVPPILAVALNPATGEWRSLPPPPFAEAADIEGFGIHSSVWTGDRLLVWAGGFLSGNPVPELWSYDPESNTWERGASAPTSGGDPDLIWDGSTLYAYGGSFTDPVRRVLTLSLAPGQSLPAPAGSGSTVDLPVNVPFELFAMEPFVQSAFVADFTGGGRQEVVDVENFVVRELGIGRFYDRSDTLLQTDSISNVSPLWDGWLTSANGEVWWFPDSISRLPFALQNAPDTSDGLHPFSYFLPARDEIRASRIWTVVPGDGLARPNARSIVRSISVETREVQTYTEVPPDAFPVNSSTTGLLLNSFEWMDTGDGFIEDPATFKMMLVEPDGNLLPLWAGFGIDLSVNRIVWMDCDEAGVECAIVVSSIKGPSSADLRVEIPGFSLRNGAVGSPNGRWLAVGIGHQGGTDQAILILDLIDGSHRTLMTSRNLSDSFGPSVTWSADSHWILSLDGDPLAIRVEDGFRVNLAEYIPEGMVVFGVASR